MTAQVAADLRAAAELLRAEGWCQGSYGQAGGPRCMDGAILSVTAYPGPYDRALSVMRPVLDITATTPLAIWNDTPGRTLDEVLDALERAAQAAEESE